MAGEGKPLSQGGQLNLEATQLLIKAAVEASDNIANALKSIDTDELVTRTTDSSGVEINPAKEDGNLATAASALGTETDAAVEGDSAGTVDAQLRGINKNAGATADAVVAAGAVGSVSSKLRRLTTDTDAIKTRVGVNGATESVSGSQAAQMAYLAARALELDFTLDAMNVTTDWAVGNVDTTTLATTLNHVTGTAAVSFAKINGDAASTTAYIEKTPTSIDASEIASHDVLNPIIYLSDITNVAYAFVRIGTNSSNYAEWRMGDELITEAVWQAFALHMDDMQPTVTGNGLNMSAITYLAVGVEFDLETNALADIRFDSLTFHTSPHATSLLGVEVTSDVSNAPVRVQKFGNNSGGSVPKDQGNATNGTQRIVIATDDLNLAPQTVDLNSLAKALAGDTTPVIDSYATASISAAAATANQSIVSTPGANKRILVMEWYGTPDTGDGSISWQDEDDTALSGVMDVSQRLMYGAKSENFAIPVMVVATNKALEMDTLTCGFKGTIGYAIEDVS